MQTSNQLYDTVVLSKEHKFYTTYSLYFRFSIVSNNFHDSVMTVVKEFYQ